MFGIMGCDATFAKVAGTHVSKLPESYIRIVANQKNPYLKLTSSGEVIVVSTVNGTKKISKHGELHDAVLNIESDINSDILIYGIISTFKDSMHFGGITLIDASHDVELEVLEIESNTQLATLDLSANTALTTLNCSDCTALATLDLSANTALTTLNCYNCTALATLNLSANTALTTLNCSDCTALQELKYPATNEDVSSAIASAITDATAEDGTVYTDSAADYYSTIADAATEKGWTIEQLA